MDYLQVPNITSCAKAKAVDAGRKMQASIIDAANKDGRDPPRYDLLELIGKGSFGLVYKGYAHLRKGAYLQMLLANNACCTTGRT
jgi:hypothetical protein